jgi:exopolysaccharide biosynthesis polyprenyl glycosylphosphotransferase
VLKNYNEQIQTSIKIVDMLIAAIAFFVAFEVRSSEWMGGGIGTWDSVAWMLAASLILHFILYPAFKFYESLRLKSVLDVVTMIVRAMVVEFFILGTLVFLLQAKTTSRYFFGLFLLINYGLLLIEKLGARILLSGIRKRGFNFRRVVIAGTGANSRRVIAVLKRNKQWGYLPSGLLVESDAETPGSEIDGVRILGKISELEQIILRETIDEIYFAPDRLAADEIAQQVSLCEKLGIPARFSLSLFEMPMSKLTLSTIGSVPVMTYYTTLMTPVDVALKRTMDLLISVVGLLITAALYPWIAWSIRRESPEAPVIFKQIRVGENGRLFKCYKFRTMRPGADQLKTELATANQMDGPMFKIENDPRVFPFGQFLRRTSLDELPQFLNILRGDMSVVGTRPPTPDEVNRYEMHYRRRLSIRPGLTGLWQVSGRSEIRKFEDVLALDLQYIDQWSIWLDVRIICKTVWVALFGKGAH